MTRTVRASSRWLGALTAVRALSVPSVLSALSVLSMLIVLSALSVLLAGCAAPVPVAAERIDRVSTAAVPFLRVDAAGSSSPAPGDLTADEAAALAVLTDLRAFAAGLPGGPGDAVLEGGYATVDGAADGTDGTGGAFCVRRPADVLGTAFFCPERDAIVADSAGLVPVLRGHYGDGALAAVLAHEFGHAVQARTGPTPADRVADPDRFPALLVELQADCFAGSFLAWAAAGSAPHVHLPPGSLVRAVAALLDFRDPPSADPTAGTAHGSAGDRFAAVDTGFTQGAAACRRMTAEQVRSATTLGSAPPVAGDAAAAMAALLQESGLVPADRAVPAPTGPTAADLAGTDTLGPLARDAATALAVADAATGDDARAASCLVGAWVGEPVRRGGADQALDYLRSRADATFAGLQAFSAGMERGAEACG